MACPGFAHPAKAKEPRRRLPAIGFGPADEKGNGANNMYVNIAKHHSHGAKLLSVLGNERRLLIMCQLMRNEVSVGEIARRVNLSQSALSQHLAKLRALNLVETRRDGQTIYYSAKCAKAERIMDVLNNILEPN